MIKAISSVKNTSNRVVTFERLDSTEKFFLTKEGRIFSVKNYTAASEKGLTKDIDDNSFSFKEEDVFITNILGASVTMFRLNDGRNTLGF